MGIKVRVLFFLCPCSCLLASSPRDGVPRLLLFTCWTKLLADNAPKAMKDQKFESCFGRKIAVSASMSIYQFLTVVGRTGMETLTNEAGASVSPHLYLGSNVFSFFLFSNAAFCFCHASYVFDGQPPELKKQELAKRQREDATEDLNAAIEVKLVTQGIEKYSKRTVKVVFDVSNLQYIICLEGMLTKTF
ncbi:unnamed protein product [Musa acuminata subsp. malaccensis]|uniref:(wild Malaysian banana) hypothetical protein n=1 Tax=Musa acuminata subsp. malaccensis TaxID=214687 RepID=A0A804K3E4_MUSAM|nr:unnamed protein product [Musa acuminata subsp. malaccensis]